MTTKRHDGFEPSIEVLLPHLVGQAIGRRGGQAKTIEGFDPGSE